MAPSYGQDAAKYWFKITSDEEIAPDLKLESTLWVSKTNLTVCHCDNNLKPIILHHLVNSDKFFKSRSSTKMQVKNTDTEFWSHMPPVRKEDYSVQEVGVPTRALDAVCSKVNTIIEDRAKYIDAWFTCHGISRKADQDFRKIASLAVADVNNATFTGELRLDCKAESIDISQLERHIEATCRESNATMQDLAHLSIFVSGLKANLKRKKHLKKKKTEHEHEADVEMKDLQQ